MFVGAGADAQSALSGQYHTPVWASPSDGSRVHVGFGHWSQQCLCAVALIVASVPVVTLIRGLDAYPVM
jgi:hypothetical protein